MKDYYEHKGYWLRQVKVKAYGFNHIDLYIGKVGEEWSVHAILTKPIRTKRKARKYIENDIELREKIRSEE